MARLSLTVLSAWYGRRGLATGGGRSRRDRNRLTPDAEPLEIRNCPSTMALSPVIDRWAHAALVTEGHHHPGRPFHQVRHEGSKRAHHPKKKPPASPGTIFVSPTGKLGPKAGKTPSHPLGSLVTALKRASSGSTIVLAPGTYVYNQGPSQNASVSNKSNITIVGAAGQASILAPTSGDAIKVVSSNNITIENVWFRSQGSQGRGLAVVGSSVTLQNIKTDGTLGDGVAATGFSGQTATVNASSCQFDAVQLGDGLDLQDGSAATINGCTFNGNGTAPNVTTASNGLVLSGGASATIVNSQFVGNTNSGLVGLDHSQVTATGSTFSSNRKGDGAIFFSRSSANLSNNTFASNGEVFGPSTGLNGLEFFGQTGDPTSFAGSAVITGNTFQNNTGNGLYIGSAPNTIQVVNNVFANNFAGLTLDGSHGAVNVNVQGNTFSVPPGAPSGSVQGGSVGLFALGSGVTATVGGSGAQANVFQDFNNNQSIFQDHVEGSPSREVGCPNLTIMANTYQRGGSSLDSSLAIHPCG